MNTIIDTIDLDTGKCKIKYKYMNMICNIEYYNATEVLLNLQCRNAVKSCEICVVY